ncbi:TPR repeat containing protein [Gracilaria domingensis]|nr:TPR repeat containing protein [Gracilaria domingensis]
MSLRDLASGTSCAPQGASSSSNPLAALTDAILPKTATPATRFRAASSSQSTSSGITPEEQALIQGRLPSNPPLNRSVPPLPSPQPHFPAPPLFDKQPLTSPFSGFAAPIGAPEVGAATDVFEAAFRNASLPQQVPPPAYRPFSHVRHPLPHLFHRPPPIPQFLFAPLPQLQRGSASSDVEQYLSSLPQSDVSDGLGKLSLSDVSSEAVASSSAQAVKQEQPSQNTTEKSSQQRAFIDTESWGDEFTSFENEDLADFVDSANETTIPERFAFSGDIEKYFERWIRSDGTERYIFEHQQQGSSKRSAEKALEDGIRNRELGRLTLAIKCFEEALNYSLEDCLSKKSRATAWYLLGISQAETDNDVRAIQAFQEGLSEWKGASVGQRREDNPYLWQSLIALSVSFTNELDVSKALRHMSEWYNLWSMRDNSDAESGVAASVRQVEDTGAGVLMEQLRRSASLYPNDTDLFLVMGILHNLREEFDNAAIAFRHAITLRSGDPSIWNKLGATLANGGDSDNALRAYRKAVDINPSLIRAWVNVGTAYSNRGEFTKAARYYLKAISMAEEEDITEVGQGNNTMLHVWEFLRTTFTSLGRTDLQSLVDARDLQVLLAHFKL